MSVAVTVVAVRVVRVATVTVPLVAVLSVHTAGRTDGGQCAGAAQLQERPSVRSTPIRSYQLFRVHTMQVCDIR